MSMDIPAWIQAVSSVLAVLASGFAVWATFNIYQRQSAEEACREEMLTAAEIERMSNELEAKRELIRILLGRCRATLERAVRKLEHNHAGRPYKGFTIENGKTTAGEIAECIQALSEFPVINAPDADTAKRILGARFWMNIACRRMEKLQEKLELKESLDKITFKEPRDKVKSYLDFSKEPDVSALIDFSVKSDED